MNELFTQKLVLKKKRNIVTLSRHCIDIDNVKILFGVDVDNVKISIDKLGKIWELETTSLLENNMFIILHGKLT